jgi:hypothetical protein
MGAWTASTNDAACDFAAEGSGLARVRQYLLRRMLLCRFPEGLI